MGELLGQGICIAIYGAEQSRIEIALARSGLSSSTVFDDLGIFEHMLLGRVCSHDSPSKRLLFSTGLSAL